MQKTKLGVSVGLLGASLYFIGMFGEYLPIIFLVGYILIAEENEWLKKTAVKAIALMISFALLFVAIRFIPSCINVIDDIFNIFGGNFELSILSHIVITICDALEVVQVVVFVILGLKAFNQSTVSIPVVDKLINKYMN